MSKMIHVLAWSLLVVPSAATAGQGPGVVLEALLAQDQTDRIVDWFKEHPDEALSFIDGYLEGALKLIEEGRPSEQARASFDKGVRFAALADRAFKETIFSQYASAFAGWDSKQQRQFREGQAKYKAGRAAEKEDEHTRALSAYHESLQLAEPLKDWWGQAMAWGGVGRTQLDMKDYAAAEVALGKAAEINGRLRLRDSQIEALIGLAEAQFRMDRRESAISTYRSAKHLLKSDDPQTLRDSLEQLSKLLKAETDPATP